MNSEYFFFFFIEISFHKRFHELIDFLFQFDELSHKSSGSSLNLAGSSNQASGQGSLENLGGGEFVRHNSKRSIGSIPSRAVHQSSSSSNLAAVAAVNAAASKSPGGNSNDWGQKLFGGNKQSKSESSLFSPCSLSSLFYFTLWS